MNRVMIPKYPNFLTVFAQKWPIFSGNFDRLMNEKKMEKKYAKDSMLQVTNGLQNDKIRASQYVHYTQSVIEF